MKFIKCLKLNKARKSILSSGKEIDINIIANNWGFGHSGQFAADYHNLFREYPSDTFRLMNP